VKSKKQIEKELWPFVRIPDQNNHAEYVKFQRDFQKKLSEQLHHNPITIYDLLFRVDLVSEDVQKLLQMDMSLRKKSQNR
jgi:hypothetical protein